MDPSPALDLRTGTQRTFLHLLLSTLVVSVMNFTVWFALTVWVFLETRSVFATGLIAGVFLVATAATGIWFGSLADHHLKKTVMQWSAVVSFLLYAACLAVYVTAEEGTFRDPGSVLLWVFVVLLMVGVVTVNLRSTAMPTLVTLVTLLVPEDRRDKNNGLVGTATGVSFLVTSVISGLLVAAGGMLFVLLLALAVLALSVANLATVRVPEDRPVRLERHTDGAGVDLRGTVRLVRGVPGLVALIAFSCFNSFLGGLVVAKVGLGRNPVRALLLVNVVLWTSTTLFPVRSSIVLLAVGMALFMVLMPFAQSIEQAASPLTAFLMGPIAQFVVIPLMTDGWGARHLGPWFGTGADRGLALVFVVTGLLLGILAMVVALCSRPYRRLSATFAATSATAPDPVAATM